MSSEKRPRRGPAGPAAGWWVFLVAGVAALAVTQLVAPRAAAVWLALQAAGLVLGLTAMGRVHPHARLGWLLLLAARVGGLGFGIWWLTVAAGGPRPSTAAFGLAQAPMFAFFAAASLRLTRRRRSAGALESGFEAAAVVVALAMLAWALVVEPFLGRSGFRQAENGVVVMYTFIDLAMLGGLVRSMVVTPRGPGRLVGAAAMAALGGHLCYAATGSTGPAAFLPGGLPFLLVQLWGVLTTAAALHPDAADLGAPPAAPASPLNRVRLAAILLTATLSPLLPVIAEVRAGRPVGSADLVPAVLLSALCGLLLGRVWVLAATGQRRARTDSRTRLANRDYFAERLAAADPAAHTLLLCGLDGFKHVNDAYGHEVGNQVLVCLAARVKACAGPAGLVARLSGDEFGLLVAAPEAAAIATAVLDAIAEPIVIGDRRIHLTAGIGLAPGTDLGDADLALQAAKRAGRHRIAPFDASLRAEQTWRTEIAEGLRQALADGSLHLAYQPVVDPGTGATVAVEALMRWGDVSPARFIPVAEQSGLIGPLGEFALREACREAARWHAAHGLYVTVNVSSQQLRNPHFAATALDALATAGLPPAALVLEITESVLIDTDEHLHELRSHGVRIAIDDFGTGYSSLAYLHRLPVDILKIDQAFVRRSDPGLLRAVLEMGRSQGLTTVAEGVETAAQAALLTSLGCPLVQGFYFARPLPPEEIDERLAAAPNAADPNAA